MKKISLIILGLLLIASLTTATLLATKQEAITLFNQQKVDKDTEAKTISEGFTYTTDKICEIEYPSGSINCEACVEFTYNTEVIKQCYYLDEDTTLAQDNERIKQNIQEDIKSMFPPEEVSYIVDNRLGIKVEK